MKTLLVACIGLPVCFAAGYALSPSSTESSRGSVRKSLFGNASTPAQGIRAGALLAEIRAAKDPLEARLSLLSLIESAEPGDLERLFSAARRSDDSSARNAAAQRWAEKDPAGFFNHLKSLPADEMEELDEVATILFRTWAHSDPVEALASAKKSSTLPGFQNSRGAVIFGALEDDPEKGFALMAKEKNIYLGQAMKKSVWDKDPARFVKAYATLPTSLSRYTYGDMAAARNEALTAWATADFPGALEWAKTLKPEARAGVMPALLGKLAETDLAQARGIFESLAPSAEREAAGPAIVAQWAKKDPQAALDWIEEKMTGGRSQAYAAWIKAAASNGMDKAAVLVASLPEGNGRDYATRTLAVEWANKDLPGAVNWIKNMPESADRRDAYGSVVGRWAEKDQAGFKDFIATVPKNELPEEYSYYIYTRNKEDQDKNVAWAASLPEDRRRPVFENAFAQAAWNRKPAEIVDLLNQVKDPELQAGASTQLLNGLLQEDSTKAGELLGLLPAGLLSADRSKELKKTIQGLGNLSDTEKQTLLTKLP